MDNKTSRTCISCGIDLTVDRCSKCVNYESYKVASKEELINRVFMINDPAIYDINVNATNERLNELIRVLHEDYDIDEMAFRTYISIVKRNEIISFDEFLELRKIGTDIKTLSERINNTPVKVVNTDSSGKTKEEMLEEMHDTINKTVDEYVGKPHAMYHPTEYDLYGYKKIIDDVYKESMKKYTTPTDRPNKDEYYLDIAKAVAQRGTCLRRKFGSIIVKDDRIVSTGYVGAPRGRINCCDRGVCYRQEHNIPSGSHYELCRSCHSEMNAVIQASAEEMKGSILYLCGIENDGSYTNAAPCAMCKRVIINAGIEYVIARQADGHIEVTPVLDYVNNDDSLDINHSGY